MIPRPPTSAEISKAYSSSTGRSFAHRRRLMNKQWVRGLSEFQLTYILAHLPTNLRTISLRLAVGYALSIAGGEIITRIVDQQEKGQ